MSFGSMPVTGAGSARSAGLNKKASPWSVNRETTCIRVANSISRCWASAIHQKRLSNSQRRRTYIADRTAGGTNWGEGSQPTAHTDSCPSPADGRPNTQRNCHSYQQSNDPHAISSERSRVRCPSAIVCLLPACGTSAPDGQSVLNQHSYG